MRLSGFVATRCFRSALSPLPPVGMNSSGDRVSGSGRVAARAERNLWDFSDAAVEVGLLTNNRLAFRSAAIDTGAGPLAKGGGFSAVRVAAAVP